MAHVSRQLKPVVLVLAALVAAALAGTSYLAIANGSRADRAEARSAASDRTVGELRARLESGGPSSGSGPAVERAELAARGSLLSSVAREYEMCKTGLTRLLGFVLDDDYASASSLMDDVSTTCASAESDLAAYEATYGS
jgi:hypothetical protein